MVAPGITATSFALLPGPSLLSSLLLINSPRVAGGTTFVMQLLLYGQTRERLFLLQCTFDVHRYAVSGHRSRTGLTGCPGWLPPCWQVPDKDRASLRG
ncbi:hypothetical protein ACKUFS_07220 [Pseudomonas cannabina]|uniref:Uncharacterized protein n=3 Tax=Pseudomonas syringae group TaxID=136849 RepID=A0A3M3Q128_PSECA|nr:MULTISPECIES: hypothetical protein [Pseudomonas syringae group]KPB71636.1 Uncharacterized protein AC507_4319 [Pseudomonas syringae pv. maculicola]KPW21346.1 hypothetical protein ALO83_103469 [Pseudomonas cannabina pv. alisalensis]MBM0138465.1 hypothetical protein [Pseudomonas cannabina pv. alisalensis]QHE97545.1 hypothetical protein PMA4326_013650 [Pseudomonas syringae pv. maculicola str. ES4326]QQN24201.1 hypothetical protein JGS08_11635 [Pseudomonas cannabina pv. alisalensis]